MSEESTNVDQQVGIETGLKVVLNGGKSEMNSATIPIKWFFSDKVLAKQPEYILVVEQNKEEMADNHSAQKGRRYLITVNDQTIKFIQFFSIN